MAGQRVTDLTAQTEQTGSGDLYMIVDVSDTSSSAQGTSKKLDSKFVIQTDKFSLDNTEVLALDSTAKVLVGALSGYMITVYNVTFLVTTPSGSESANKNMLMGYDSSTTNSYWASHRGFMNGLSDDRAFSFSAEPPASATIDGTILNKPFVIWSTGAFNGDWTAEIYVTYAYTKVL